MVLHKDAIVTGTQMELKTFRTTVERQCTGLGLPVLKPKYNTSAFSHHIAVLKR